MKKLTLFFSFLIFSTSFVFAQGPDGSKPQGENLKVPEGWEWRFDRVGKEEVNVGVDAESADVFFVNMTPGWHVTSGPAGIYYHEDNQATGNFTLSSTIYLFDTKGRNREAFGMFIGGENLDNDNQSYLYFLIRNTGEYLIKRRMGDETLVVQSWKKAESMNMFTEETESSAQNDFEVKVQGDEVLFSLNGKLLSSFEKGDLPTNGTYGLRVNHSINLHILNLELKSE